MESTNADAQKAANALTTLWGVASKDWTKTGFILGMLFVGIHEGYNDFVKPSLQPAAPAVSREEIRSIVTSVVQEQLADTTKEFDSRIDELGHRIDDVMLLRAAAPRQTQRLAAGAGPTQ